MIDGPSYLFQCFDCGRQAFLIRGSCDRCEPALHARHHAQMQAYREAHDEFLRETGKTPLQDWYGFEEWCRQ